MHDFVNDHVRIFASNLDFLCIFKISMGIGIASFLMGLMIYIRIKKWWWGLILRNYLTISACTIGFIIYCFYDSIKKIDYGDKTFVDWFFDYNFGGTIIFIVATIWLHHMIKYAIDCKNKLSIPTYFLLFFTLTNPLINLYIYYRLSQIMKIIEKSHDLKMITFYKNQHVEITKNMYKFEICVFCFTSLYWIIFVFFKYIKNFAYSVNKKIQQETLKLRSNTRNTANNINLDWDVGCCPDIENLDTDTDFDSDE